MAGVDVGQGEEGAGEVNGEGLVAIEGVKQDAGGAVGGVDVGAEVEFEKPGEAGDGRAETGADGIHPEGDDGEVGEVVGVGVNVEAGGKGRLNGGGVPRPVEEEEVAPALIHDRRTGGADAGGGALFGGGGGHGGGAAEMTNDE